MTMMACAAGKDVYVEKPLTLFVREGRWMVDVARRHQPGRPGRHAAALGAALPEGARADPAAGTSARSSRSGCGPTATSCPGFGSPPDGDPPAGARLRPVARSRAQAAVQPEPVALPLPLVLGLLRRADDQPRPALARHRPLVPGRRRPRRPSPAPAAGSRCGTTARRPTRRTPCSNTPGWTATWSHRECSRGADPVRGLEFCGTRGSLTISRKGFVVTPDPKIAPEDAIPRFGGAHPVGGPASTGERDVGGAPDRSRRGPFRRRVRPVPPPRPQLPRLRPVAPASRSPTWRARTASRRPATWRTCRCGSAASCAGTPSVRRSSATPRPRPCSSGPTGRPGTPRRRLCWRDMIHANDSTCRCSPPACQAAAGPGRASARARRPSRAPAGW